MSYSLSLSLSSLHPSIPISLQYKSWVVWIKESWLLVGWLSPRWQVVIGVIYHPWKGLRAHHTNCTSARCCSRGAAHSHTAHIHTHFTLSHTKHFKFNFTFKKQNAHCSLQQTCTPYAYACAWTKNHMFLPFPFTQMKDEQKKCIHSQIQFLKHQYVTRSLQQLRKGHFEYSKTYR